MTPAPRPSGADLAAAERIVVGGLVADVTTAAAAGALASVSVLGVLDPVRAALYRALRAVLRSGRPVSPSAVLEAVGQLGDDAIAAAGELDRCRAAAAGAVDPAAAFAAAVAAVADEGRRQTAIWAPIVASWAAEGKGAPAPPAGELAPRRAPRPMPPGETSRRRRRRVVVVR